MVQLLTNRFSLLIQEEASWMASNYDHLSKMKMLLPILHNVATQL